MVEYEKLWPGFRQKPEVLGTYYSAFLVPGTCFICSAAKWHPYRICCVLVLFISRLSLGWGSSSGFLCVCMCMCLLCVCVCVCVRPSLKAFKREWERVWNPGMTSLSMMSFLQGDFGTCDRLGEVTLSLLTRCNWQWNSRSQQIEQCQI